MTEALRGASQTAVLVAGYRARATAAAEPVCDDPWAASLGGEIGEALSRRWDQYSPSMELWVALRTRYIDDTVKRALASGIEQVVILGAGLDTRAARLAQPGVRFFELDQPASQADKRTRLAKLVGYPLDAATFVSCDFETDDFVERLAEAGHDASEPTCFVWEGVVYYLDEDAGRATFSRLAREFEPRSLVVFDYMNTNMAKSSDRLRDVDRGMKAMVEELGEPIRSGIDDLTPLMFETGYRFVRSATFDELALQYTGTYKRDRYFRFQAMGLVSAAPQEDEW